MTTPLLQDLLLAAAPVSQYQGTKLRTIVQEELTRINTEVSLPQHDSGCLFADAGDFLVRATMLLAELATGIAESRHLHAYVDQKAEEMEEDHDFSEMKLLDYLEEKHSYIKDLGLQLQETARNAQVSWESSPQPVFERVPTAVMHAPEGAHHRLPIPSSLGLEVHAPSVEGGDGRNIMSQKDHAYPAYRTMLDRRSDESSDPSAIDGPQSPTRVNPRSGQEPTPMSDESTLSVRGKGHHVCPHGTACTKGGVAADGSVVVFERNSAFRAHLQKHEKKFRCRIPGCTNRTGFARIDQLRRHEQNVQHGPPQNAAASMLHHPTAHIPQHVR